MKKNQSTTAGKGNSSGHRPRKRFGQNFLHDRAVIEQIIQAFDPDPELAIVEIGPGQGALTLPLLQLAGRLTAIEIDRDLASALADKCRAAGELKLHVADALKFDFSTLHPAPIQVIGNLPYNISTPLIFHLLKTSAQTRVMLLMLQKEVADRICALHDQADYGRLSVMVQSCCLVEKLFEVPASAFTPAPKVTSAVVQLRPNPVRAGTINDTKLLADVVRQAFAQRRKTLRNALRGLLDENCLHSVSISPACRPENVSVEDYIKLANVLYKLQNQ